MNVQPLIPRPGMRFGAYPERRPSQQNASWFSAAAFRAWLKSPKTPGWLSRKRFLSQIDVTKKRLADIDMPLLQAQARRLRMRLRVDGLNWQNVAETFAVIAVVMQKTIGVAPYSQQFLAAWLMLDNRLVEMETGEGKTYAIALASLTGGMAGIPMHVVTANEYLVQRDAEQLTRIAGYLDLGVGYVTPDTPPEQRKRAYANNITFVTAKELVFDYLRDHLASQNSGEDDPLCCSEETVLPGLCMAIVDEADSILLDEARMPLVLAHAPTNAQQAAQVAFYRQAMFLSAQLTEWRDYTIDKDWMMVRLTPEGEKATETLGMRVGGNWRSKILRDETLTLALAAQHLYERDRHYLVQDQDVVIVDETTGRLSEGRKWARGLHQLIEIKEGCPVTADHATQARTSFQRFFPRYMRWSGISGTLAEAAQECLAIYGLPVVKVPLRVPSQRQYLRSKVFFAADKRWDYVTQRLKALQQAGRPCLVGTDSVGDSEALSACLTRAGIVHTLLNARTSADEARIIAQAGGPGVITIATNMAGRGTDIKMSAAVLEQGGLHVISCQSNKSQRVDRQLYGRCARQGTPGSVECIFYLSDTDWEAAGFPRGLLILAKMCSKSTERLADSFATVVVRILQRSRERQEQRDRWQIFLHEHSLDRLLAIAGPRE